MWKKLNGLEKVKPMIWINEIPWHEMNIDDELMKSLHKAKDIIM